MPPEKTGMEEAIIAAGCFWCTEAIFKRLIGVTQVEVGFTGGSLPEPTYKQVCHGQTGHAEAIRIIYDPKKISYWDILEIFWKAHDPTTLNPKQQQIALKSKELIEQSGIFSDPIVTEILPATIFYPAKEEYHQNYYENNTDRGYCIFSIAPKINKIHNLFQKKIKPEYQNLENENRTQETL